MDAPAESQHAQEQVMHDEVPFHLTERLKKALDTAQGLPGRVKGESVGADQLLQGILKLGEGVAVEILRRLKVNTVLIDLKLANRLAESEKARARTAKRPTGAPVDRIVSLAAQEARRLGSEVVGTEHALLAILRLNDSYAAELLRGAGVMYGQVRVICKEGVGRSESGAKIGLFTPVSLHLHSDGAVPVDKLNYTLYAKAVTEFLYHKDTKPPLTVGVLAPWGQGKTTLMKLIEQEFKRRIHGRSTPSEGAPVPPTAKNGQPHDEWLLGASGLRHWLKTRAFPAPKKLAYPTVWFNAWKFENCDQLWASLAQTMITELVAKLAPLDQERFWLNLNLRRLDQQRIRQDFHRTLFEAVLPRLLLWAVPGVLGCIGWIGAVAAGVQGDLLTLFGAGPIMMLAGSAWTWFKPDPQRVETMFKDKFSLYLRRPDYDGKTGFFSHVEDDTRRVLELLVDPERPAVVFVDDLDRCSPRKVAETVEAINLFLSGGFKECFFILGMDAQVVAASLDAAYEGLIPNLGHIEKSYGSVGWYFMEKFVQLPFTIPNLTGQQRVDFLASLLSERRSPATAEADASDQPPSDVQAAITAIEDELQSGPTAARSLLDRSENFQLLRQHSPADFERLALRAIQTAAEEFTDEDREVQQELSRYGPFLGSSPRSIKRYVNLYRFYRMAQWSRQLQGLPTASSGALGFWLLIMVRWPLIARWIQWESEVRPEHGHTPRERAAMIDDLILTCSTHAEWTTQIEKRQLQNVGGIADPRLFAALKQLRDDADALVQAVDMGVW